MAGASPGSTRDRMLDDVRRHPGSSAREIQRRLGLGWGDTAYQLDRLSRAGEIRRERGGWRDYYFAPELTWADRRTVQALRSPAERCLALTALDHPDSTYTDLVQLSGLARSTASFHLRKLTELNVLVAKDAGSGARFTVVDPDRLRSLLSTYASSFGDEILDRFAETFAGVTE
jgi:predicted transcriptional regulator